MHLHPHPHPAIARELARLEQLSPQQVHPAYRALVAAAAELGLPHQHACDITIYDHVLIDRLRPPQLAWLLHERGSLLSIPEPNTRPLEYLHAARRLFGQALPFWWDGDRLIRAEQIDELIERMAVACAELRQKARELL